MHEENNSSPPSSSLSSQQYSMTNSSSVQLNHHQLQKQQFNNNHYQKIMEDEEEKEKQANKSTSVSKLSKFTSTDIMTQLTKPKINNASVSSSPSSISSPISPSSVSQSSLTSTTLTVLNGTDSLANNFTSNALLDIHKGKPIRLQVKVLVPVSDHPNFNFIGKLLGPKGNSLKWLQEQTMTKIAILGKGSMRDKEKEEELRQTNDPMYAHLNQELHVDITTFAPAPEAYLRIGHALQEVKRFLVPDYYDDIRQQQLRELGVLNPEPRVVNHNKSLSPSSPPPSSSSSSTTLNKSMNCESPHLLEKCLHIDDSHPITKVHPFHHHHHHHHHQQNQQLSSIQSTRELYYGHHLENKARKHHLRYNDNGQYYNVDEHIIYDCEQIPLKITKEAPYDDRDYSEFKKSKVTQYGNLKNYHLPHNIDEELDDLNFKYQCAGKITNRAQRTYYKAVSPYAKHF